MGFEKFEILIEPIRQEHALAAVRVSGDRNDLSLRDCIDTEEVRRLVRTAQRRGQDQRQRSEQKRQHNEYERGPCKQSAGASLDGGLGSQRGIQFVNAGHSFPTQRPRVGLLKDNFRAAIGGLITHGHGDGSTHRRWRFNALPFDFAVSRSAADISVVLPGHLQRSAIRHFSHNGRRATQT